MEQNHIKLLTNDEIEALGINLINVNGAVNPDGDIEIWFSKCKIPPWLRTKELRTSKQYEIWRKSVFERDGYTCQKCHQLGGDFKCTSY